MAFIHQFSYEVKREHLSYHCASWGFLKGHFATFYVGVQSVLMVNVVSEAINS